ncbi:hypothetical protein C1X53_12840 [Pseudomonas sp. GW456-E6]|nr:hypothetical protein C1X55_29855 [Pseudomonas sp. GW460-C8]PMW23431.1 hypothetical protein C1X53_12840 [Pseudomonas sp. GW456-E6]PMW62691.1 hypothetical protein C1X39_03475 [Pseudomonas sp. GW456-12-1-14-TSB1]PMW80101.1 hypothetical protein C1X36_08830 [Pseudomonas sp. GW460-8]PMY22993.1 hypothetical protein C1X54_05590 [Pseudomonas sp. GW460-13]
MRFCFGLDLGKVIIVPLWTKLVVAAVMPFVVGVENAGAELPSSGEAVVALANTTGAPQEAIHGFISWLSDSDQPGEQISLERLVELAGEWEETHA